MLRASNMGGSVRKRAFPPLQRRPVDDTRQRVWIEESQEGSRNPSEMVSGESRRTKRRARPSSLPPSTRRFPRIGATTPGGTALLTKIHPLVSAGGDGYPS